MQPLFSPRIRRLVATAAVLSAVAMLVGILYGSRFTAPMATPRDSYGTGPLGHRAFVETLQALGVRVERLRRGNYTASQSPLLLLEPESREARVEGRLHDLRDLLTERSAAQLTTIVVLPKWDLTGPEGRGRASLDEPALATVLEAVFSVPPAVKRVGELAGPAVQTRALGELGSFAIEIPFLQVLTPSEAYRPLLETEQGALVVEVNDPNVIVMSDPDVLHNFNLQRADHAQLGLAAVRWFETVDTVLLDETFHGHGIELSLGDVLGRFPGVLLTIHGVLLICLLAFAGAARFGTPESIPPSYERGPKEAIGVSASVLVAGQPPARLAADYVDNVLSDLSARIGIDKTGAALPDAIDAVARRRGIAPVARVLSENVGRLLGERRRRERDALRVGSMAHRFRQRLSGVIEPKTRRGE